MDLDTSARLSSLAQAGETTTMLCSWTRTATSLQVIEVPVVKLSISGIASWLSDTGIPNETLFVLPEVTGKLTDFSRV